jgi:hypothetical protein
MNRLNLIKTGMAAILLLLSGSVLMAQDTDTTVRYNQYGVKVNRNRLNAEERNGILTLESSNQNYRVGMMPGCRWMELHFLVTLTTRSVTEPPSGGPDLP